MIGIGWTHWTLILTIELTVPVPGWVVKHKNGIEVFTSPEGVEYIRGSFARCDLIVTYLQEMGLPPLYLRKPSEQSKQRLQSVCTRHRLYQAKRKPRTNCEQCWSAYRSKTDGIQSQVGDKEQGTSETVSTAIPPTE